MRGRESGGSCVRRDARAVLLGGFLLVTLTGAGCQSLFSRRPAPPPIEEGDLVVHLEVLQGRDGGTLAMVPVYIDGQGPFAFALDTGASHTLVDRRLAERLQLPVVGPSIEMTGVATTTRADQVRADRWRVGDVELPAKTLVSLDMSDLDKHSGLEGLLGSDVLRQFIVTVDYANQLLILHVRG
jgi:predicted aspartyl protease